MDIFDRKVKNGLLDYIRMVLCFDLLVITAHMY